MFMPPIFSLNGRFWFAYWVFLFYLIQYLRSGKLKYVLLPALTLLIHQAFIVAYALFLIFHFTHKFKGVNYVYYILAILSFLFANIGVVAIFDFASAFGGQYESWMTGYASEEGIIKRAEFLGNKDVSFGHWFWQKKNVYLYNSLLLIFIYLRFVKKIHFDNFSEKLFQISIVFFIFHNLVESVPDLGDRYNTILIAILLLILFKLSIINNYTEIRLSFLIILLPLLISLLFVLRMESESLNAYVFFENPYSFYLNDDGLRLINLFDPM
jgi:hypothetical protein